MLKRSPLLEYVLTRAQSLARANGKKTTNSNYFVAALYDALAAYADGATFPEINTPEGGKEISAVFQRLKEYGKDFDEKSEALCAFMKKEDYSSTSDDLLFGMFSYKAEGRAKKEGKDVIDTPAFLAVVLAEPTAAIRALVLRETPAPVAEERKDDTPAEKAEENAPAKKEKSEDTDRKSTRLELQSR